LISAKKTQFIRSPLFDICAQPENQGIRKTYIISGTQTLTGSIIDQIRIGKLDY